MYRKQLSNCEKIYFLIWRNLNIEKNRLLTLVCVLTLPSLGAVAANVVRFRYEAKWRPRTTYEPQGLENFEEVWNISRAAADIKRLVMFAPSNEILERLVTEALRPFNIQIQSMDSIKEMETHFIADPFFAGIVFNANAKYIVRLEDFNTFDYSIRFPKLLRTNSNYDWNVANLRPEIIKARYTTWDDGGPDCGYIREGFLLLQNALNKAYFNMILNVTNVPEIKVQRFPYAQYKDYSGFDLSVVIATILHISFMPFSIMLMKEISSETIRNLKLTLEMLGIPHFMQWTTWGVHFFVLSGIAAGLMQHILTISLFRYGVFENGSKLLIFIFLLLHTANMMAFSLVLSQFIQEYSELMCAICCTIMFCIAYAAPDNCDLIWSVIPCLGLIHGTRLLFTYEQYNTGVQWKHLFVVLGPIQNKSLGNIMICMVFSTIMLIFLFLFFEWVSNKDNRFRRRWRNPLRSDVEELQPPVRTAYKKSYEKPKTFVNPSVRVEKLRKDEGNRTVVNDVTIDFYENEVTTLAGYNGSGRKTFLSLICGFIKPTSGSAYIKGYSITKEARAARSIMAYCSNHNGLFRHLSVKDHFIFFSRLRGYSWKKSLEEADKFLALSNMTDKADVLAGTLDPNSEKILCVCCAFCGGTEVLVFYNITKGLMLKYRRMIWKIVQSQKMDRTIIVSVPHLHEAESIGDRIGIMCCGEIRCFGTSFYLKRLFGNGYTLTFMKGKGFREDRLTKFLQSRSKDILLRYESNKDIVYTVPFSRASRLVSIFDSLKSSKHELKYQQFSVDVSDIQEILMNIGTSVTDSGDQTPDELDCLSRMKIYFVHEKYFLRKSSMFFNNLKAILWKRYLFYIHTNFLVMFIIATTMGFIIASAFRLTYDDTASEIKMSLLDYPSTYVYLELPENSTDESSLNKEYEKIVSRDNLKVNTVEYGNMNAELLRFGKDNQFSLDEDLLIGMSAENGTIIAWFNNQFLHTSPLSLHIVYQALLGEAMNTIMANKTRKKISIETSNWPFVTEHPYKTLDEKALTFSLLFSFMIMLLTTFLLIDLVYERESYFKLLQFHANVKPSIFWLGQFLADYLVYFISCLMLTLMLAIVFQDKINSFMEIVSYGLLLFMYGFDRLPYLYVLSSFFSYPFKAIAFDLIFICIAILFKLITNDSKSEIISYVGYIPYFDFLWALHKLSLAIDEKHKCPECDDLLYLRFAEPGIGKNLVGFLTRGAIWLTIITLLELNIPRKIKYLFSKRKVNMDLRDYNGNIHIDVLREKFLISQMDPVARAEHSLVVNLVSKDYRSTRVIHNISFRIRKGESFCLCGNQNSGKSAILRMLTGQETINEGHIFINGFRLKKDRRLLFKKIGFVPQCDALTNILTTYEILYYFSMIYGVQKSCRNKLINYLVNLFDLKRNLNERTKDLSYSIKKRLTFAIAFIGHPSIVFLDDPTYNADPMSRKRMWSIVKALKRSGVSVFITCRRWEEWGRLCSKVGVISHGRLVLYGPLQYIRSVRRNGIVILLKVLPDEHPHTEALELTKVDVDNNDASTNGSFIVPADIGDFHIGYEENVKNIFVQIKRIYPHAVKLLSFGNFLKIIIPMQNIDWVAVLTFLRAKQNELKIEEFLVRQKTYEETQVLI